MRIARQELLAKLGTCKRALSTKGQIPVLASYCFAGDFVYAFDGVVAIAEPYSLGEFVGALPGATLHQWLDAVSGDEVRVEVKDPSVEWKCGRRRLKLGALPGTAFPVAEWPEPEHWIELDAHFLDYLRAAATSMGSDDQHPWRMGVTVGFPDSKSMEFLASDNVSVACVVGEYAIPEALEGSAVILPPQAVAALLAEECPVEMGVTAAWVHFGYQSKRQVLVRSSSATDVARFHLIIQGQDWGAPFARVSERLEASVLETCKVVKTTDLVRAELCVRGEELSIECSDGVVTIADTVAFKGRDGAHGDCDVHANPALLGRAIEYVEEVRLTENAILMRSPSVRFLVSTMR